MTKASYHSALWMPSHSDASERFICPQGTAFQHNIENGLPEEMQDVEILYSEPPWEHGYKAFFDRVGSVPERSYADFIKLIGLEIKRLGKPAVVVSGKRGLRHLEPEDTCKVTLNGAVAQACLWGVRVDPAPGLSTKKLLAIMAHQYSSVGDFCCGYGNAVRAFVVAGKMFIASDINPGCIGYIEAHYKEWAR